MGSSGAACGGEGGVTTPVTSTDKAVVRFVGVAGAEISNSLLILSDAGEGSGLTRLDVDNLRFDGNTISSTNTNGTITLDPNGTGAVQVATGALLQIGGATSGDVALKATHDGYCLIRKGDDSGYIDNLICGVIWSMTSGTPNARISADGVELRSGSQILWSSSTTDATQGKDTGTRRGTAGVIIDTDGGVGLGARLTGRVVEASTAGSGAPNILGATESRKLLTNESATAEAYNTLPVSAPIGCEFQVYCADADGIRLTAPTGETIRTGPGAVSAAAGFIRSVVVGSGITLTKVSATTWVAVNAPNGTWTIDI